MSDKKWCAWCGKWGEHTSGCCPDLKAHSELSATPCSASHPIASAYRDPDGWCLFDGAGDVIEEWPSDWPKYVDRKFIESKGIEVR